MNITGSIETAVSTFKLEEWWMWQVLSKRLSSNSN